MTTATVLALVRDILSDEPWSDTINASYTTPAATMTISDYAELVRGDTLDFQDDGSYDLVLVNDNPTSSAVSVSNGYDGSTAASHSNGARYYKSPRYASHKIVAAITHVVNTRLWPDLWVPSTSSITPSPSSTNLYDLPADFLSLENDNMYLYQAALGSIEDPVYSYGQVVKVPSSVSTSTLALRVTHWARTDVNATLFYRAKVTTSNMTAAMEPVIALGTAAYLRSIEAAEKAERFDEDDRAGRTLRSARDLWTHFDEEKQKLAKTLSDVYGKPPNRFKKRRFG